MFKEKRRGGKRDEKKSFPSYFLTLILSSYYVPKKFENLEEDTIAII